MPYNSSMTLTKLDLKSINQVVKETINENLDRRLGPNLEKDDIKHLPTKDKFYNRMDKESGELKVAREERETLSGQVSSHSDRIERIEKHIGIPAPEF